MKFDIWSRAKVNLKLLFRKTQIYNVAIGTVKYTRGLKSGSKDHKNINTI